MLSRAVLQRALALVGMSGCSTILGIGDLELADGNTTTSDGSDGAPPLPACKAQRAVHLVAGNGGLAWFTLEWPPPPVIQGFQATYAYDDPAKAASVGSTAHPLFARTIGIVARPLWVGTGASPHPTAFVAGTNQTHTNIPIQSSGGGTEILAAGAILQVESLQPALPVLAFTNGNPYGPVNGQPTPVTVGDVNTAVKALKDMGIVTQTVADNELRPSQAQIDTYVTPGAPANVVTLANQLAFTANAFRLGVVGSVMMQAFNDDPHNAFDSNIAPTRADQLATVLDAFYADLATANETTCGTGSQPLSLADNTVLLVTGDTPKDSYARTAWPDGTTGNSNLVYVRSNGFLKPGWFGEIADNGKTNWNHQTGGLDATAPDGLPSLVAATIYAIARGDTTSVTRFSDRMFQGVIEAN